MPSFKGKVTDNQCIINVIVFKSSPKEDRIISEDVSFRALIDTGAQRSCISQNVVKKLDLSPKEKVPMNSAAGKTTSNEYDVDILIPIEKRSQSIKDGKIAERRELSIKPHISVRVMEWKSNDGKIDVLLGLDILLLCNFILAHKEFIISF